MQKIIKFTAPPRLVGYLNFLARDTMLGTTANDVALHLLTVEAERRLAAEYHQQNPPSAEPPAGEKQES